MRQRISQAHLGFDLARSLSFAAVVRDRSDGERDRFASASLSVPLWRGSTAQSQRDAGLDDGGDTTSDSPVGTARIVAQRVRFGAAAAWAGTSCSGLQRSPPGCGCRLSPADIAWRRIEPLFAQGVLRTESANSNWRVELQRQSPGHARWSGSVIPIATAYSRRATTGCLRQRRRRRAACACIAISTVAVSRANASHGCPDCARSSAIACRSRPRICRWIGDREQRDHARART